MSKFSCDLHYGKTKKKNYPVLANGFQKKTQKTLRKEIEMALKIKIKIEYETEQQRNDA
jgi:phage-related protein